jgi:hypothetical protein
MARISRKGSGPGLQAFNGKFRFSEFGIRAETGAPKAFGAPVRDFKREIRMAPCSDMPIGCKRRAIGETPSALAKRPGV